MGGGTRRIGARALFLARARMRALARDTHEGGEREERKGGKGWVIERREG